MSLKRPAESEMGENSTRPYKLTRIFHPDPALALEDAVREALTSSAHPDVVSIISYCVDGWAPDQRAAIRCIYTGQSVFLTGAAGTGKTKLLNYIVENYRGRSETTAVTSSTGASAALLPEGQTIHSWSGCGAMSGTARDIIRKMRSEARKRWENCLFLCIDEISMISADDFDKLDEVARIVRRSSRPFGGIQLLVVGDFFQLPPVKGKFAFHSTSWTKTIQTHIELTTVHRQGSDLEFVRILHEIRMGTCSPESERVLRSTNANNLQNFKGFEFTKMASRKAEVERLNRERQLSLQNPVEVCTEIDEKGRPSQATLTLGIGAQVMYLVNDLHSQPPLFNGLRGVVVSFAAGHPIVRFVNGAQTTVRPRRHPGHRGPGTGPLRLPLELAWATTVHKAQGRTIDFLEVSLADAFEAGQVYAALSRVEAIYKLRVTSFDRTKVRASTDALVFHNKHFPRATPSRYHSIGHEIPLDNAERFGTITGTSVKQLLTPGGALEACCTIFQVAPKAQTPEMKAGHDEEEQTARLYSQTRDKEEGSIVPLLYGKFVRDETRPFLGGTPDRTSVDGKQGIECKYLAGSKNGSHVDIHSRRCSGTRQLCVCLPPPEYSDQVFFVGMVCKLERYDIVVRSGVDLQYIRVDPRNQAWLDGCMPEVYHFVTRYTLWYWADVRTEATTRALRDLFTEHNEKVLTSMLGGEGLYDDAQLVDIKRLFEATPPPPRHLIDQTRKCVKDLGLSFPI